jgi:hypothetical protein
VTTGTASGVKWPAASTNLELYAQDLDAILESMAQRRAAPSTGMSREVSGYCQSGSISVFAEQPSPGTPNVRFPTE